ncbi:MAG: hypothetical protein NVS4B7_20650 [Ktedonobacteraceae bacterium]
MPSLPVRCMLFVSSYFPLTLIFFIFLLDKQHPLLILQQPAQYLGAIIILLVGIAGLVSMWLYFRFTAPGKTLFHEKITSLQRRDGDTMSYIASYIVPFATFPLDNWQTIAALIIFVLILLVVYVNSNMIYINPMLNLCGYHFYEVTVEHSESSHYLLTQQHVVRGKTIRVVRIGDGAYLETKA